ncbi:DUF2306 domain-containing protein [Polaribacter litorisediminis]|uniref:DUF2306 domain-containing protein n=1 Tax=Polaribacter litorisediminis TaxID=1908341 RepID=UPI001CBF322F|nr:DUF2306 domain-containing protein [Polaribacter litorisediminis]UAM99046.1 DUF2306 domain-containing protein [Polaribacter litorisediminis]
MNKSSKSYVLENVTILWFLVTLIGQWIFAFYVAIYHGSLIFQKGLKGMGETHMPNSYISGDSLGNIILATHLVTAVIIIGGGPLQLIPQIRLKFPRFHRWLGRMYMLFACFGAMAGLYLIWTRPRPSFGNLFQEVAISIEGVLILIFSFLALRYAIVRKIHIHRRWALRLFITASGVWFLRIGYKFWYFIEDLLGFKLENFFDFWSFGSFLIPLAVLEFYLRIKDKKNKSKQLALAILLFVLTLIMSVGIFLAVKEMWLPRILKVV